MYSQTDFERNKQQSKQMMMKMLLSALPGVALGIAGIVTRIELMCSIGLVIAGAVLIFMYDLKPVLRYGRYLKEIHSGLSRRTAGTLMRVGEDPVYVDGVWLYEMIINVYEDLSEEGERRFLLDSTKPFDKALIGHDIIVTSHGSSVLNVEAMEEKHAAEAE